MSIPNFLKSALVVGVGALFGYSVVKIFTQPNENNRQLASVTFSKLGTEQFAKTLFDVKIKNEDIALFANEVSTIKVTIEAFKAIPEGLAFNWNFPDSMTVVEGDISGNLQDFSANQTKELILKIKGYSKEVQNYVSFTVKGTLNQKLIERDILISSRPEDSFEYVVQETEKAKATQSKLFNKLGRKEVKSPIDLDKVSF